MRVGLAVLGPGVVITPGREGRGARGGNFDVTKREIERESERERGGEGRKAERMGDIKREDKREIKEVDEREREGDCDRVGENGVQDTAGGSKREGERGKTRTWTTCKGTKPW